MSDYEKYFSTEEINDVLKPYENFVQSLPGFVGLSVNESGNVCTVIQMYDTPENANLAYTHQFTETNNSIVLTRHKLFKIKIK